MTSYKPNYIQKVSSRNATTLKVRVSTCPSPGNLPDTGIEPRSLALQADSLVLAPPRKPKCALPRKSYGRRSLVGSSPRDHKELDMTEST